MKSTLTTILAVLVTGCAWHQPYTAQEIAQIEAARQHKQPAYHQGIYQAVGEEMRFRSTQGR